MTIMSLCAYEQLWVCKKMASNLVYIIHRTECTIIIFIIIVLRELVMRTSLADKHTRDTKLTGRRKKNL